jgi:hypothetical protein
MGPFWNGETGSVHLGMQKLDGLILGGLGSLLCANLCNNPDGHWRPQELHFSLWEGWTFVF